MGKEKFVVKVYRSHEAKCTRKKYIYNDLGLAIVSSKSLVPTSRAKAKAREGEVSVVGVPVPDRGLLPELSQKKEKNTLKKKHN